MSRFILDKLRIQIEKNDALIIKTLAKRQELVKQIGRLKLDEGKDIVDPLREEKLFAYYEQLSLKHHLDADFVKKIFKIIIAYSKTVQNLISKHE